MKHLRVALDIAFSILRMPSGAPKEEHFTMLKEAFGEVEKLWNELGLSYTPKFHALMRHALEQMRRIGGCGEMLEDRVEKSHATSGEPSTILFPLSALAVFHRLKSARKEAMIRACGASSSLRVLSSEAVLARFNLYARSSHTTILLILVFYFALALLYRLQC
jgi:hypothetical protein